MNEIKTLLHDLIEAKSWKALKLELNKLEPYQIAQAIEQLSPSEGLLLFRLLPRELAKETFSNLSHDEQESIIEGLANNSEMITGLLNDLDPDDRTAFF